MAAAADRTLEYLGRRPGTLQHLTSSLDLSERDALDGVEDLRLDGWVVEAYAWYNSPAEALTIYLLTPKGRQEAARRNELARRRERAA
jgi:hypothetical protein